MNGDADSSTPNTAPRGGGRALLPAARAAPILLVAAALGLNALMACALVVGTALALARAWRAPISRGGRLCLGAACGFAALLAWRDSPLLTFLNTLCVVLALGLSSAGPVRLVQLMARAAGLACGGALALLFGTAWQTSLSRMRHERSVKVLRGVLLAAPILTVFGALLASADAAFGFLLSNLLSWDLAALWKSSWTTLLWSWASAGLLYLGLLAPGQAEPPPGAGRLGLTETGIVLGSVATLFMAFIAVQFAYFFGGHAQVTALTGLTYAEYARRGFFELLTVASLVVALLLGARHFLTPGARESRLFGGPCVVIAVLVGVMLLSAWRRMLLYVGVYGLTEERVLALTFMAWIGGALAWLVLTMLLGRYQRFALGALVLGLGAVAALNVVNPAHLIAGVNIGRVLSTQAPDQAYFPPDLGYLTQVGADAWPLVLSATREAPQARRFVLRTLAEQVRQRPCGARTWNWSRARAYIALTHESGSELDLVAGSTCSSH